MSEEIDQAFNLRRLAASVLVSRIARAQADEHGAEDVEEEDAERWDEAFEGGTR